MSRLNVAVLMGGISSERTVSLSTGRQIIDALDRSRYEPIGVDTAALFGAVGVDPAPADLAQVKLDDLFREDSRPDVAFLALHGKGGEDGTIQGFLDLLGIPYTGSGVLASALAMDKHMSKIVMRAHGVPVAGEILVRRDSMPDLEELQYQVQEGFGYPVVVKPNREGSTIGCTIVKDPADLSGAIAAALELDDLVLIEQFVEGTEITVGVLGNANPEALPIIEIEARGGFYDYEAKYAPGGSTHIIPARISAAASAMARDHAVQAHLALGCRGMSRVDMIVQGDRICVLEVNTIPGMTPVSLLPDAAKAAGIAFPQLLDRLIGYALELHA